MRGLDGSQSMDTSDKKLSEIVEVVRSWIPRRTKPSNLSTDFWMPDQSGRACYECDSQFTVFNRKHHCRICGRVFCAKCTANSVSSPSYEPRTGRDYWERFRVCNYCFRQWEQGVARVDNETPSATPCISRSPSTRSLASTKSSCTYHSSSSTVGSVPYSTGPYQRLPTSPHQYSQMDLLTHVQQNVPSDRNTSSSAASRDLAFNQFGYCFNRSDDEDDDYGVYHSHSEYRLFSHVNDYDDPVNLHGIDHVNGPHETHPDRDNVETNCLLPPQNLDLEGLNGTQAPRKEVNEHDHDDGCKTSHNEECTRAEPVDFENRRLLWLPPEPEDEEDDREAILFDDDDDDVGASREWGCLQPSASFDSGEYQSRDKSIVQHRKAMKNVVESHFRALVAQLLLVENLPICDDDKGSWLDIITALSLEAASLLKPDIIKGGGMDPGGLVKVKCIACGHRSESVVVKGVVCKKNVAHRRMISKIDKPYCLILGGALEYQHVSNQLSSVKTLLQQEMDHLKMAVAKIDYCHTNVLLVEKSVSRYAQEYLLAKDISLVLNIKRPLLERIAHCTGAQIAPSIDHLTSQKRGQCETFHVDKFFEEYGSARQGGRKSTKTLMFFEGCPTRLGFTILLKGANGEELKKVKHVIQYGVFAAYHLALETSFLVDEGASFSELPLKSPIDVVLPDEPSFIGRSISSIPRFSRLTATEHKKTEPIKEEPKSNDGNMTKRTLTHVHEFSQDTTPAKDIPPSHCNKKDETNGPDDFYQYRQDERREAKLDNDFIPGSFSKPSGQRGSNHIFCASSATSEGGNLEQSYVKHDDSVIHRDMVNSREHFPPSTSDHQYILFFLSTRCVWKGTICEKSHLEKIKYYGTSDKPFGRYLEDQLFDQSYRCCSCEMPSEAHVYCYTHLQGSLTISVKKLPEFLLPGEREGKIWMWHRCLKCPHVNGFPRAVRRVVMSDAAWGLSFGKFLELSFSNHVAASKVSSCGHSLHRDCLRFYGFGKMVACFRYASIDLHSVCLPPSKLEFSYDNQDWLQQEANEVHNRAKILFNEVCNVLLQMSEKVSGPVRQEGGNKASDFKHLITELEGMLQKEREEFLELLQKALHKEVKVGLPVVDILELNKLHRHILIHSHVWDQRLIYASNPRRSDLQEDSEISFPMLKEKPIGSREKIVEENVTPGPASGHSSCDYLLETKPHGIQNEGNTGHLSQSGEDKDIDMSYGKLDLSLFGFANTSGRSDPLEFEGAVQRVLLEGESHLMRTLSGTLDAAWTGESQLTKKENDYQPTDSAHESKLLFEGLDTRWTGMPFPQLFSSFDKNSLNTQKFYEYNPIYILSFQDLVCRSRARLLLPAGINNTIVPVYDNEPTSIIAYALVSLDYHVQMSESQEPKDSGDGSVSLPFFDSVGLISRSSSDETITGSYRSLGSSDESILSTSGSWSSQVGDPLLYAKDLHAKVSFTDDSSLGKVKYTVTCYYAKRFETLRRTCCPSELDFVRSISRCKKWGAQGGKSNVFFAKSPDDRFIIKQVTKTELESFIKFGPSYFKYLSESINSRSPTCLARVLGIYQVSLKHLKAGKDTKMDVLVAENLLFRRNIRRLYDLKGSARSRYNPDTSGNNKVLLDQNLIEAMPTSPIFVGNKAKRLLERAVWNDTAFLASIYVMDYSLLVGVDEENHELVVGIIDFIRQYTWDKHLETWVKTSVILGGSKNTSPTVISPQQHKKRFRKAMSAYFLSVPDQWSSPMLPTSGSQSEVGDENS